MAGALTRVAFAGDEAVFDAVLFNLQVIGEAIKNLPQEVRAGLSEAHRSAPARMRDLIAHRYFALDPDIVWDVARRQVPALCSEAMAVRARFDVDVDGDGERSDRVP